MTWHYPQFDEDALAFHPLPPEGVDCVFEMVSGIQFVGQRFGLHCPTFVVNRWRSEGMRKDDVGLSTVRRWALVKEEA